jgi:hypothetical protein
MRNVREVREIREMNGSEQPLGMTTGWLSVGTFFDYLFSFVAGL